MDKQLEKSNVLNMIKSKGEYNAYQRCYSYSMKKEVTVVGYIPFYESFKGMLFINENFKVNPYNVVMGNAYFPICKEIYSAKGKSYICDNLLTIELDFSDTSNTRLKRLCANNPIQSGTELQKMVLINNMQIANVVNKNEICTYEAKDDEYELCRSSYEKKYIVKKFICLCTHINEYKGSLEYILMPPEDLLLMIESDKNTE